MVARSGIQDPQQGGELGGWLVGKQSVGVGDDQEKPAGGGAGRVEGVVQALLEGVPVVAVVVREGQGRGAFGQQPGRGAALAAVDDDVADRRRR